MMRDVTSRHLRGTTELTLLAPIRPGFVGISEVMSYATRLQLLLKTVFALRKVPTEQELRDSGGALESLQTIHFTHWAVLGPEQDYLLPAQREAEPVLHEQMLLFTVTFDRSWEEYIHIIVDKGGPILDLLFSHCVGYEGHSCRDGYEAFASWVRAHQVQFQFAYAAAPELTVDDLRYLKTLAAPQSQIAAVQTVPQALRLLTVLLDLRDYFPGDPEATSSDRSVFDDGVRALLPAHTLELPFEGLKLPSGLSTWLEELRESQTRALQRRESKRQGEWREPPVAKDIQGNVVEGYTGMTHGCMVLVHARSANALRALLARLQSKVTSQADAAGQPLEGHKLNIALTYPGLKRLGLPESTLALFPKELREGMEERAGLIGDVGTNHPEHWQRPEAVPLTLVHVVITLQAHIASPHAPENFAWSEGNPLLSHYRELALEKDAGLWVVGVQPLRRFFEARGDKDPWLNREHFGFLDAGSQPVPTWQDKPWPRAPADAVHSDYAPLGDFLLGYPDSRGDIAQASVRDATLFKNGTFMALRKLAQDVAAFEQFAADNAQRTEHSATRVKELIVGRDHAGRPLVEPQVTGNAFDYQNDPQGARCPLHAHIRRSNPRTAEHVPRILRRGFSYGPRYDRHDPGSAARERGMMFVACGASIAAQFEVIQRWLNGGNSTGLYSAQSDVLTAPPSAAGVNSVPGANGQPVALVAPKQPLVSLRWGLYLFVPSLTALRSLGERARPELLAAERVAAGDAIIDNLELLEPMRGHATARNAWKSLLEEETQRASARELWAAVSASNRLRPTPYGVLAGHPAQVKHVLGGDDGARYSVCTYGARMKDAFDAKLYLGLDADTPEYRQASAVPNRLIAEITRQDAWEKTREIARRVLDEQGSGEVKLRELTGRILGEVAHEFLGAPLRPELMLQFVVTSRYIFQIDPEPAVKALAVKFGAEICTAYADPAVLEHPFAKALAAQGGAFYRDVKQVRTALIGATSGFAAATLGSLNQVLNIWIESGEFWALSHQVQALDQQGAPPSAALFEPLIAAMKLAPVPGIVHRAAKGEAQATCPHQRTIVGLGAAASADPSPDAWYWLFGGKFGDDKRPHACPGTELALGAMLGVASALLERKHFKRLRPLVLDYTAD